MCLAVRRKRSDVSAGLSIPGTRSLLIPFRVAVSPLEMAAANAGVANARIRPPTCENGCQTSFRSETSSGHHGMGCPKGGFVSAAGARTLAKASPDMT
jgi:hypothetical protein